MREFMNRYTVAFGVRSFEFPSLSFQLGDGMLEARSSELEAMRANPGRFNKRGH